MRNMQIMIFTLVRTSSIVAEAQNFTTDFSITDHGVHIFFGAIIVVLSVSMIGVFVCKIALELDH